MLPFFFQGAEKVPVLLFFLVFFFIKVITSSGCLGPTPGCWMFGYLGVPSLAACLTGSWVPSLTVCLKGTLGPSLGVSLPILSPLFFARLFFSAMTCVVLKVTMSQTLDALQHGSQRGYQEKELKLQDSVPFFAEENGKKKHLYIFLKIYSSGGCERRTWAPLNLDPMIPNYLLSPKNEGC